MATASPVNGDGFQEALRSAEARLRGCPETRARFKRTVTRAFEAAQQEQPPPAPAPQRAPERRQERRGLLGWLLAGVAALFHATPR